MSIPALPGADTYLQSLERSDPSRGIRVQNAVGLNPTLVPDGLKSAGSARVANLPDSRSLVSKALSAARSVVSGLDDLRQIAQTATHESYLDALPDISRLTLQADLQQRLRRMDLAVKEATVGSNNLVSGSFGSIRLSTTGLGGSLEVAVQALDSTSLGIARLDLTTAQGVAEANHLIALARADAAVKAERLSGLARTFDVQASFIEDINATVASRVMATPGYGRSGSSRETSQRGALIDLRA